MAVLLSDMQFGMADLLTGIGLESSSSTWKTGVYEALRATPSASTTLAKGVAPCTNADDAVFAASSSSEPKVASLVDVMRSACRE